MYSYIYRISNLINGKTYIGQHQYKNLNDRYMGSGTYLKRSKKKYGLKNFHKTILCHSISCKRTINVIEKLFIKRERQLGKGEYNSTSGGKRYWKHSKEIRNKISKSLIGNERCKGKNLNNKNDLGNILTEETRKQMGESRKGNSNNGVKYLKCVETEEVFRVREWIDKGYNNAHLVAQGNRPHCKKLHFEYVTP